MDLKRFTGEEKLDLCRKYFRGGFIFLPFLWLVNAVWFFQEAFYHPFYEEQKQIKNYVIMSAIGAFLWMTGLITWIVIFQNYRASWGATADYISFIIPTGIA